MKILIVGDVCAAPGRRVLHKTLPDLIRRENIDFCIVNGENAAHGVGITPKIADEFFLEFEHGVSTAASVAEQI